MRDTEQDTGGPITRYGTSRTTSVAWAGEIGHLQSHPGDWSALTCRKATPAAGCLETHSPGWAAAVPHPQSLGSWAVLTHNSRSPSPTLDRHWSTRRNDARAKGKAASSGMLKKIMWECKVLHGLSTGCRRYCFAPYHWGKSR